MSAALQTTQPQVASENSHPEGRFFCPLCAAIYREGYDRCPRDGSELDASARDPLIGRLLGGRYRITDLLGEGGMGRVYRAEHERSGRPVAIKTLFGDLAAAPRNRLRFSNEARAASRLDHPNVVPVIDYGYESDEPLFLVMELVDGETLDDRLERGALSESEAIQIATQLARGLGHAHERGVVHRDLKPSNIGLTRRRGRIEARIFDFGLALVADERGDRTRLTTTGMIHGTPLYLAPELARGETADHRSDLYALGIIVHEMVTGRAPFEGDGVYELLSQHLSTRPPSLSERCGRPVSAELEMVVNRLLCKRRESRYASAAQLVEALERIADLAASLPPPMAAPIDEDAATNATTDDEPAAVESHRSTAKLPAERSERWHGSPARWVFGVSVAAVAAVVAVAVGTGEYRLPVEVGASAAAASRPAEPAPPAAEREPSAQAEAPSVAAEPEPRARRAPPRPSREPSSIPMRTFSNQYARTGAAVERLRIADRAAGERLRRDYFQAGYARAVQEPSDRAEVMRRLRAIEKKANRLLGAARTARAAR